MQYWFVVHSLNSYRENRNLIGFAERISASNEKTPINNFVNMIMPKDKIIYYCKGKNLILGIFEIKKKVYKLEKRWRIYPIQFKIKPVLLPSKKINFKKLVFSKKLDMFKRLNDISRWGSVIQGRNVIKPLTNNDFKLIQNELENL